MNTPNSWQIDLQRRNPSQNMARFYGLSIQVDLFGIWILSRNWGRIGSVGQSKYQSFNNAQDAYIILDRLHRQKLKRGYTPVRTGTS
ncbi:WGR domain-containing protein [Brucella pseudogrignonensis]|uniref:WGR domain-containing protein n=1 Tax=Brucella pseudogrignonensis TaxID=419475 RepID=UPI002869F170|nr:WGR domain-containing protein [Brucella pseudogrignonensis]